MRLIEKMDRAKRSLSIAYALAMLIILTCTLLLSVPGVSALGIGTFDREFEYTADQTSSILYYIVKDSDENPLVYLDYSGELEDYVSFRISENYWYSTRLDELDVSLQHGFDLTNSTSANLTFYTRYDIEYGWDFGYVEISTDEGLSWDQLNGTGTTSYRDGAAYVGIPGAQAYTGSVGSWTFETMDLDPYVGNETLIRFRYMTDSYYSEHGWLVDDISVSAIGFFDDVQSGDNGWNSTGWVNDVISLDGSGTTVPIYLDFVIPDSFVYSGEPQQVIVISIPGLDADYNPTQLSAQKVIGLLPPVVKYMPPPAPSAPSSGGGGGSSGSVRPYVPVQTRPGQVIVYYAPVIPANTEHRISGLPSDTPLRNIALRLYLYTRDARVMITPLDGMPSSIKQRLPGVYRFFEIDTVNVYESVIDSVTLEVGVPKAWLSAQRGLRDEVTVSRFSAGQWTDLPTRFLREDASEYYYSADTPGFSVFAVRLKSQLPVPDVIRAVPTEKPNISQVKPITFVAGNQSAQDAIQDIKEELVAKSDVSPDELEDIFPHEESPTIVKWLPLIIALPVAAVILGIAIILHMRRKRPLPPQEVGGQDAGAAGTDDAEKGLRQDVKGQDAKE